MQQSLLSPAKLKEQLPLTDNEQAWVHTTRTIIGDIVTLQDPRLLVVVGPCAIHDIQAGQEYARKLATLQAELSDRLCIVMRAYFEKPRTTSGWKGLIPDPMMDDTHDYVSGLKAAREFLKCLISLRLPAATEILDPLVHPYIADCICWGAIGARTVESPIHRQIASMMPFSIGFKNNTEGSILTAIQAKQVAIQPHTFLTLNDEGMAIIQTSRGNACSHIILRGGRCGPNYDANSVRQAIDQLRHQGLSEAIMIDCAHDNSGKNHSMQSLVCQSVLEQLPHTPEIIGIMLESNLKAGSQLFPAPNQKLEYGVSVNDPCLSFEQTERLLRQMHSAMGLRTTQTQKTVLARA